MAFFYAGMGLAMMTALYSIFQVNLARMQQLAGQGQDYNITNRFRDQVYSDPKYSDPESKYAYAQTDRKLLKQIASIKSCQEINLGEFPGYSKSGNIPYSVTSLDPAFDASDLCIYEKNYNTFKHRVLIGSLPGTSSTVGKKYKFASCVIKAPCSLCYFEVDHMMPSNQSKQSASYFGQCS